MACRNLCQRLYSKIIFGKSHYEGGKKYCRRCEIYFSYDGVFCPCCGMGLRMSPTSKRDKERLRQLKRREEEQYRIIMRKTLHQWLYSDSNLNTSSDSNLKFGSASSLSLHTFS